MKNEKENPEEIKLQPIDKTKLKKYQKENPELDENTESLGVEQPETKIFDYTDSKNTLFSFEVLKEMGLIGNIKSLHNTNAEYLKNGITICKGGYSYNLFDVKTIVVDVQMIASNLSKLCRYSGNTSKFYSVAEHSIEVSKALLLNYGNVKLALAGLFHDGSEAFLNDMLYTIKKEMGKDSPYAIFEENIERHIFEHFGVEEYLHSPVIKHIDVQTCNIEFETLLSRKLSRKLSLVTDNNINGITTMLPAEAEKAFITQYYLLEHLISEYDDKECLCEVGSHKPKENV